ncbi:putative 12-oxophytodienoate reductase 11 [Ananas comosus]|uniref:Putative 12-oxophytodienoate reductase 11 n=1 Tax=Ananas comosus TaxID=4615 RepID=A0A199VSN6_ANACO|nr:putative 12-oxophytodienoate reductase 11 [Ananas comosus]
MGSDTIPLLTPYKMGNFDLSHRYPNTPGIWTKEQVEAWKPIVDAIQPNGQPPFHAPTGQWHLKCERMASTSLNRLHKAISDREIPLIVNDFRVAARMLSKLVSMVSRSMGPRVFDRPVLKDQVNDRTDKYGGS